MTSSSLLIAAALALGMATIATGHEHGDSRTLPANANSHGHNHEDDGGHTRSGSRPVDMADRASHRENDGITMIHPHHSKPLPANLIGDDDDMDSHKRMTKHAGARRDGGQGHGDGWPTTDHEHAGEKVEQRRGAGDDSEIADDEGMRRKKANTRTSTSNRRKDGGEGWAHSTPAGEPMMDVTPVIDVDETPVEHYAELRVHQPDVTHRQTVVEQEPVEIEYAPIVVRHDPVIREESRPFAFRPPQ